MLCCQEAHNILLPENLWASVVTSRQSVGGCLRLLVSVYKAYYSRPCLIFRTTDFNVFSLGDAWQWKEIGSKEKEWLSVDFPLSMYLLRGFGCLGLEERELSLHATPAAAPGM